ncbi:MAG: hypothetical protein WC560_07110 [Syntrophales bacterium]
MSAGSKPSSLMPAIIKGSDFVGPVSIRANSSPTIKQAEEKSGTPYTLKFIKYIFSVTFFTLLIVNTPFISFCDIQANHPGLLLASICILKSFIYVSVSKT